MRLLRNSIILTLSMFLSVCCASPLKINAIDENAGKYGTSVEELSLTSENGAEITIEMTSEHSIIRVIGTEKNFEFIVKENRVYHHVGLEFVEIASINKVRDISIKNEDISLFALRDDSNIDPDDFRLYSRDVRVIEWDKSLPELGAQAAEGVMWGIIVGLFSKEIAFTAILSSAAKGAIGDMVKEIILPNDNFSCLVNLETYVHALCTQLKALGVTVLENEDIVIDGYGWDIDPSLGVAPMGCKMAALDYPF